MNETNFVADALSLLAEFTDGSRAARAKCRANDARYYEPGMPSQTSAACCAPQGYDPLETERTGRYATVTPALFSVGESLTADLCAAYPEPVFLGRAPGDDALAGALSAMIRAQREHGNHRAEYRRMVKRLVRRGMAVMACAWDEELLAGRGDVALRELDFMRFYPDPLTENIQEGRACFVVTPRHISYFKERWPGQAARVAEGASEDGQVSLVEYWYRTFDRETNTRAVHLALIAGDALLRDTRAEAPNGVYAHGRYPFVMYRMHAVEGAPWGLGLCDLFGAMQDYIDVADHAAMKSMLMSATAKLLVREGAIRDAESVTDWRREVVEVQGAGADIRSALAWFQATPMSGLNIQQYESKIALLKDMSGQNAFARGEAGQGVTAATAILALQEAGSKVTFMLRDALFDAERELAVMQLELTRERYDASRFARLSSAQTAGGTVVAPDARLKADQWDALREQRWPDGSLAHPPMEFDITVKVQKASSFSTLQHNELVLQLAALAQKQGSPIPPATVIGMMTFEGKEAFVAAMEAAAAGEAGPGV